jgi:hypothetical protein
MDEKKDNSAEEEILKGVAAIVYAGSQWFPFHIIPQDLMRFMTHQLELTRYRL